MGHGISKKDFIAAFKSKDAAKIITLAVNTTAVLSIIKVPQFVIIRKCITTHSLSQGDDDPIKLALYFAAYKPRKHIFLMQDINKASNSHKNPSLMINTISPC
jgi:hypothetical protein